MSDKDNLEKNTEHPSGSSKHLRRISLGSFAAMPRKRKRWILIGSLAMVFIALGVTYGVHWALVGRYRVSTDDAYVVGNQVAVMAQEKGTVVAVLADNTTHVHRGQTLVRLDDSNARIALQQAKAQLADTVRQINALQATEQQLQDRVAK